MKRIIKDYFTFSKKERIAVVILLLLMAAFIVAPYLYQVKFEPPVISKELAAFIAVGDTQQAAGTSAEEKFTATPAVTKVSVFPFDPNLASETDWERLGLAARTARTIINYRNKGGRFRTPEDIRKIWGLRKEDADRLIPYVQIAIKPQAVKGANAGKDVSAKQPFKKKAAPIDINTATADEWRSLPGIHDFLAGRIVKFRDVVGGFRSIEQVKKTYGISDSLFAMIRPYLVLYTATIPKTNLNTASAYELRSRADLPYAVAKAIVSYREQNGPFRSVEDLQKILSMPDSVWQKLILSLKVE
jgi:competence protein ComEA